MHFQIAQFSDGVVPGAVAPGVKKPLSSRCAERTRGRIDASGMYRQDLARLVGLSPNAIYQCEDGTHVPKLSTVERIADALGISPTWLAYGDEGTLPFKPRRPRPALPLDPPVPEPDSRPARNLWRGVGERLAYARTQMGLSLRQISDAAGVSRQTVLLVERGQNEPLISTVEALAVALGVAPGWLAFGEGDSSEASERASA